MNRLGPLRQDISRGDGFAGGKASLANRPT